MAYEAAEACSLYWEQRFIWSVLQMDYLSGRLLLNSKLDCDGALIGTDRIASLDGSDLLLMRTDIDVVS